MLRNRGENSLDLCGFPGRKTAQPIQITFSLKNRVLLRNKTIAAPTQTRGAVSLFWLSAPRSFLSLFHFLIMPDSHNHKNQAARMNRYVLVNTYLADIDKQAQKRMERLTVQIKRAPGITEQLKAENALEWTQRMNNIRACAKEIVEKEIISGGEKSPAAYLFLAL